MNGRTNKPNQTKPDLLTLAIAGQRQTGTVHKEAW